MATQRLKVTNTTRQMVTLLLPLDHGAHRLGFEKSVLNRQSGETTVNRSILKLPTSISLTPKGMRGDSVEDLPTELLDAPEIAAAKKKGTIKVETYEPKTNETGDSAPTNAIAGSSDAPAAPPPAGDAPTGEAPATSSNTATGGDSATDAGAIVPNASPVSSAGEISSTSKSAAKRGSRE